MSETIYYHPSGAEAANGSSGDLQVMNFNSMGIDINTTAQAGTNPTIQFFYERKGDDGIYYPLWQSNIFSAAANAISTAIGPGMAYALLLGNIGRLRWVIGGTASPSFTFSAEIYAK